MKELIKRIVKYIIIFIGVLIILMSLLLSTMKIPRSAIYGNLKQSTEYFKKRHMVYFIQRNREYTYLHLYSESALLSIIYYVDTDNVLESAMHDRYYESAFPDTNKDFIKAINNDEEANTQYLRYWHGNMVWVRPLLTLFSIQKIFWINYCIINVLFAILLFMLLKRSKKLALIYVIAMIVIAFPIVGISVLYSSMFYLMIIASMIAIKIEQKGNDNLYILFFVIGMLTCFFDFLTTELITLYVPILFVLFLRKERDKKFSFKDGITFVVKASIVWAIAYVAMWGAKWLLASIVLKRNAMEYVIDNLKLRINGVEGSISLKRMYSEVISKNFFTLYPLCNMKGRKKHFRILIVLILTFIALIDWKNIKKKKYSLLMLMIAIIPYIRFLALVNHSYKHYFFTYRSQIITVIAVSMILVDSLNYDIWFKEIGRKRKKIIHPLGSVPEGKGEEVMLKTKNGITLIALIITIIVLLILAGTTISLIVGDNGILQKSQTAKLNTEIGQEKEFVGIAYSGAKTKKVAQGDYTSVKGIELDAELQANGVDARAEGDDPIIVTFNISRRQYIIDGTGNVLPSGNVSEPNIDFNSVMEEARQNRIGDEEIGIGTDGSIVNMGLWTYTQDDEKKTINLQGDSGSIISPAYIGDIVDGRIIGAVPQYIMPEGSNEFYTVTAMEAGLVGIKNLIYAPEIPETVVDMTDTFSSCSNLINMPELPPGIQNMQGAFSYCTSLTDIVTIPNSIQNLNGTFRNCTGLTNITVDIPNTTSPLSMVYTFEDCSNLVNAPVLSNNTTELFGTFDGCTSLLEPPIIPEGVTSIGQIFDGCTSLRTAPAIPEGVINMNYAFADCTSITAAPEIPSSVIMMSSAFLNCSNLTGDLVINTNSIQSYNAIYGTGYADCLKGTSTNANCDLKLTGTASTTTLNTILSTKSPDSHISLK